MKVSSEHSRFRVLSDLHPHTTDCYRNGKGRRSLAGSVIVHHVAGALANGLQFGSGSPIGIVTDSEGFRPGCRDQICAFFSAFVLTCDSVSAGSERFRDVQDRPVVQECAAPLRGTCITFALFQSRPVENRSTPSTGEKARLSRRSSRDSFAAFPPKFRAPIDFDLPREANLCKNYRANFAGESP